MADEHPLDAEGFKLCHCGQRSVVMRVGRGVATPLCPEHAIDISADKRPPELDPLRPYYERCTDPACPVAYAYQRVDGTEDPHYHFKGSPDHPAWDAP